MPRRNSRRDSRGSNGSKGSSGSKESSDPPKATVGPKASKTLSTPTAGKTTSSASKSSKKKDKDQWAPALTEDEAAAKIQAFLAGKRERTQQQKEIAAAIKIQAAMRGRQVRKANKARGVADSAPVAKEINGTVLLIPHPCPIRARMMMGVVSWLLDEGSKRVIVWTGGASAALVPEKATVLSTHGMENLDEIVANFEKPFREANIRKSTQLNFELDTRNIWKPLKQKSATVIEEVQPTIVLVDSVLACQEGYNVSKLTDCSYYSLNTAGRPSAGSVEDDSEEDSDGEVETGEVPVPAKAGTMKTSNSVAGGTPARMTPWTKLIAGAKALVKEKVKETEVYTGPMATSFSRELEGETGEWVKASDEPLVVVCFGDLEVLGDKLIEKICRGLLNGKWRILWKLRESEQKFLPEDVKSGSATKPEMWRVVTDLDLSAVLKFPSVKCFISSCGCENVYKAMIHAIPIVCVPIFQNQYKWAESLSGERECGIQLGKMSLNMATLSRAIAECFTSSYLKRNSMLCQKELLEFEDDIKATLGLPPNGHTGAACVGALIIGHVTAEQVMNLQNEYVDPPPEVARSLAPKEKEKGNSGGAALQRQNTESAAPGDQFSSQLSNTSREGVSRGRSGLLTTRSCDSLPNWDTIDEAEEVHLQRTLLIDAPPERGDPDFIEPKKGDCAERCAKCSIM